MNKLSKIRFIIIAVVVISIVSLIGAIKLWEVYGFWWIMAIGWAIFIGLNAFLVVFHYKHVKYQCPSCGTVFKPRFLRMLFAPHMPTKRRLSCPNCDKKSWCTEILDE